MAELRHSPIGIQTGGMVSFGGDQGRFPDRAIRRCGCGLIAATDLLLYLQTYHGAEIPFLPPKKDGILTQTQYAQAVDAVRRHGLQPVYPFGLTGFTLAGGLERIFRSCGLGLRASWFVPSGKLFAQAEHMLAADLPVIFSAGNNFPLVFGNRRLALYNRPFASYDSIADATKGHFFTVTGMKDNWVQISSWGRRLYFQRDEFERYAKNASSPLLCSMVRLEQR